MDFCQRCIAFGAGCGIYIILSNYVFPVAPDEIIGSTFREKEEVCESMQTSLKTTTLGDRTLNGSEESLVMLLDDDESLSDASAFPQVLISSFHGLVTSQPLHRKRIVGSSSFDSLDEPNNNLNLGVSQKLDPTGKCPTNRNRRIFNFAFWTKYIRGTDLIDTEARRKWRVTMLLLVSLAVHNFPEGLAVAASALHSPRLGVTTTIAIALHNIPEGIAIAIPCVAARPDLPWLAFALASLSGLAEPMGAVVALLVIDQNSGDTGVSVKDESLYVLICNAIMNMKNVLSFVAGMMMTVAIVELFPEARRHMKETSIPGILGTLVGAIIMLASDAYLATE
jgi:ZIP family zinc transporter